MVTKYIALAAATASFLGVSAQDLSTPNFLKFRLPAEALAIKACHPDGEYRVGGPIIPPCIAEQYLSYKCEFQSEYLKPGNLQDAAKFEAYRKCLFGPPSTYDQDRRACLECKLKNHAHTQQANDWWNRFFDSAREKLMSATKPTEKGLWTLVEEQIRAEGYQWPQPPPARDGNVPDVGLTEYYINRPKVQQTGEFKVENVAAQNVGVVMQRPMDNGGCLGTGSVAGIEPRWARFNGMQRRESANDGLSEKVVFVPFEHLVRTNSDDSFSYGLVQGSPRIVTDMRPPTSSSQQGSDVQIEKNAGQVSIKSLTDKSASSHWQAGGEVAELVVDQISHGVAGATDRLFTIGEDEGISL
ncbi:hypothetical protein CDD81_4617 [Ophiocordyceps australis]|uniref:Uncharacterized protein n=1 Tax=Ophiocordyceps australis TaxID=1399860 RepID=A0A2C5Y9K6_9HYPO|nr:hypothetical protein CDD81_4617 [Ophiocordyceps australis]